MCYLLSKSAPPPSASQNVHSVLVPAARVSDQEYFALGTPVHYRSSLPVAVRTPND